MHENFDTKFLSEIANPENNQNLTGEARDDKKMRDLDDPSIRKEIHIIANGLFDKVVNSSENQNINIPRDVIVDYFRKIGGVNTDITKLIKLFCEDLIDTMEDYSRRESDRSKVQTTFSSIHESLFSDSNSIVSSLHPSDIFFLSLRASRNQELQGIFGRSFTMEIERLDDGDTEIIKKFIAHAPIEEQLDSLDQLVAVAANIRGLGYGNSMRSVESIQNLITEIQINARTELLETKSRGALKIISQEINDPRFGIVTYESQRSRARLSASVTEAERLASWNLSRQLEPDVPLYKGDTFLKVASDAVAITDHSRLPKYITHIDTSRLPKTEGLSKREINTVLQLNSENFSHPRELFVHSEYIENRLGHKAVEIGLVERSGHSLWREISPALGERIQKLLTSQEVLVKFNQSLRDEDERLNKEMGDTNEGATDAFLQKFEATMPSILSENREPGIQRLSILWQEYSRYKEKNSLEECFNIAVDCIGILNAKRFLDLDENINSSKAHALTKAGRRLVLSYNAVLAAFDRNARVYKNKLTDLQKSIEVDTKRTTAVRTYISEWGYIKQHKNELVEDIHEFAKKLESHIDYTPIDAHFVPYENLQRDPDYNPYGLPQRNLPLLFKHLHSPDITESINSRYGISISELPLRTQLHLLRFLADEGDKTTADKLKYTLSNHPEAKEDILRSFLVASEDTEYGHTILELADLCTSEEDTKLLFGSYRTYTETIQVRIANALTRLHELYPNISLSEESLLQSFLRRGKYYLMDCKRRLKESGTELSRTEIIQKLADDLQKEVPSDAVLRSDFSHIAELLNKKGVVDLRDFSREQELLLESMGTSDSKSILLEVLQQEGKLKIVPEFHWSVDRDLRSYEERFGVDLNGLLEEFKSKRNPELPKPILLEIGPGSGQSMKDRFGTGLSRGYMEFGLADNVYFSLQPVLERIVDFEKLEERTGTKMDTSERLRITDYLYRILSLKTGTTEMGVRYDTDFYSGINKNINNLKAIWPTLTEKLDGLPAVPGGPSVHISANEVEYTKKIRPRGLEIALSALQENPLEFLKANENFYEHLDAFPPNVMLGDISEISKIQKNQISIELAVRSTVYKRGAEYIHFLDDLYDRLEVGGIALDDSFRDNDGYRYRYEELHTFKGHHPDAEVLIIFGPPISGEDPIQDRPVPLSMIITKQGSSQTLWNKYKKKGCHIEVL